jgi:type II secretory pathway pseudopilin PulG
MRFSFRRLGFTIAELLIVMGVIGIIAEMTIPALVRDNEKIQTASQLSKAYTTIAEAVKLSEIDNGSNEFWDWGVGGEYLATFEKYFAPYLKVTKYCTEDLFSIVNCGYGVSGTQKIYWIKGTTYLSGGIFAWWGGTLVVLADGMTMFLTKGNYVDPIGNSGVSDSNAKLVLVDVNGGKPPNRIGRDVFIFILVPDRGLMPNLYDGDDSDIDDYCRNMTGKFGASCAAKIMKDGWQIKSDYPWDVY